MKNTKISFLVHVVTALAFSCALAETRPWTNAEGKSITGELRRVEGDTASILVAGKKYDIPISTLSEADQAYIAEWQSASSGAAADPAVAYDTPVMKAMESSLLKLEGRSLKDFALTSPEKIEVLAFYSSASWCGPCHAFTPDLIRAYESLKRKYDNFELVLLSSDRDRASWEGYVTEYKMPFPALDFDASDEKGTLRSGSNVRGIPAIHIMTRDGTILDDSSSGARAGLEKLEEILKEKAATKGS